MECFVHFPAKRRSRQNNVHLFQPITGRHLGAGALTANERADWVGTVLTAFSTHLNPLQEYLNDRVLLGRAICHFAS